ncbi:hypothetical protein HU200_048725 [Digitaria exilis]|uniref:Protein kinase domain-containing protein n=1 Tax=Digitaria exilis TaxID=1010633 RepID=A0A835AUK2_9POAL|nr:hypothetical protein HU200_048725 [Digitaria exilis]
MGDQESEIEDLERVFNTAKATPIKISYGALRLITQNFAQVIGSGTFGLVYLGKLQNGAMIAVKKLSLRIEDISNKKFLDEVDVLRRLNHKNIVRFLGYCADTHGEVMDVEGKLRVVEEPQRLLCFEYAPNGNLHDYIREKSYGFEWHIRYQIIKGVCQGLSYLHQERINHLDLKPENVLLGPQMVPKITDFGLSRCFVAQKSVIFTSNIFGTRGYIAPELIDNQQISFKTDIYSLGITLVKLLTQSNEITENWHESLEQDCPQMKRCAQIALSCIKWDPKDRPTIREILDQLDDTETKFRKVDTAVYEPSKDPESSLYQV